MVANTLSGKKKFFLIAGVLSFLLLLPVTGTALSPKQSSTRIVLDTPVREVNYNDTIVFKGKLINALDNSGGGIEYFGSKGNKFYIIGSYSPPSPNEFENNYKQVLNSLIF